MTLRSDLTDSVSVSPHWRLARPNRVLALQVPSPDSAE